ncbi:MAG: PepSY domain-containing protein [Burkholderiaceae bacterium]|jgi:hypothetical protein
MKSLIPVATVFAMTFSGAVLAGDDCTSPMADWKSREAVTAHATSLGVTTDRLRIDDGCYEIRGRDTDGNRVELKIEPATLAIMELEVRFRPGANTSRYLPGSQSQTAQPAASQAGAAPTPAPASPAAATRAEIN